MEEHFWGDFSCGKKQPKWTHMKCLIKHSKPSGDLILKPCPLLQTSKPNCCLNNTFSTARGLGMSNISFRPDSSETGQEACPFTDSQQGISADPDSGRPEQLRGPGGGSGWVQVGHGVQHRLDHEGSHGGLQAARARLRHACHQCK